MTEQNPTQKNLDNEVKIVEKLTGVTTKILYDHSQRITYVKSFGCSRFDTIYTPEELANLADYNPNSITDAFPVSDNYIFGDLFKRLAMARSEKRIGALLQSKTAWGQFPIMQQYISKQRDVVLGSIDDFLYGRFTEYAFSLTKKSHEIGDVICVLASKPYQQIMRDHAATVAIFGYELGLTLNGATLIADFGENIEPMVLHPGQEYSESQFVRRLTEIPEEPIFDKKNPGDYELFQSLIAHTKYPLITFRQIKKERLGPILDLL